MLKQVNKTILFFTFLWFSSISCTEQRNVEPIDLENGKGVFIVNEGNFQFSNSSLTYYNYETNHEQQKVFQRTNSIPLGDVAQSMSLKDSLGYVVLNNSGRVYVFNVRTFEYVGWINGLTSPRYIHFVNSTKGYITDLYARSITIFNPVSLEVTGHILVDNSSGDFNQHSTEQMVQYKNLLFVNCWSFDNKILVIDTDTDQWIDSIEVGVQPESMVLDANNKLWVLTDGGYDGNPFGFENPRLVRINPDNLIVDKQFNFDKTTSPKDLQVNAAKDELFFINGGVWKVNVYADIFPEKPFIENHGRLFYALGVHPETNDIYVSDAIDYMQPGRVYRYSSTGQAIDTIETGIVPGSFCFE